MRLMSFWSGEWLFFVGFSRDDSWVDPVSRGGQLWIGILHMEGDETGSLVTPDG